MTVSDDTNLLISLEVLFLTCFSTLLCIKEQNDHLLVYTDLLHPKCLSIQQGDTLGLRADSSDAFYFFGHCLFANDPRVCVCVCVPSKCCEWVCVVPDCSVCLEMDAVCERVCECCCVEVYLRV